MPGVDRRRPVDARRSRSTATTRSPTDNQSGDTYGPVNYYAYVPFELAFPWSGTGTTCPAAHARLGLFDLLDDGRPLLPRAPDPARAAAGTRLGSILAFGWAACPYTAYALESNSNDSLVAVAPRRRTAPDRLVAGRGGDDCAREPGRSSRRWRWRRSSRSACATEPGEPPGDCAGAAPLRPAAIGAFRDRLRAVTALVLAGPAVGPRALTFWHRTIASQADRDSPFSIWGQASLGWPARRGQGRCRRPRDRRRLHARAAETCARSPRSAPR